MTMEDVFDYTDTYQHNGWRVIPIIPAGKRPPMHSWQTIATTDTNTIHQWWLGQYADHGIGIATGQESGVFVLDVDVSEGKTGDETLHELEQTHGPLPDTATVLTGSGGVHYYFQHPEGIEIRNDAGRKLGPGLDIRGEGGQVVAPPSVHQSGNPYAWVGGEPAPVAPAPEWLIELITAQPEPTHQPVTRVSSNADEDSVAARYNQRTTWAELLTADGWTLDHTDRTGEQHWTRPGKDEGTSATVGWNGQDMMRVFTSSIPWLPENPYSRFGYYAQRHHAGDRSQAARTLRDYDMAAVNAWEATLPTTLPAPTPADIEELDHGWEPTDLAAILHGTHEQVTPTILTRMDGAALLYPARINALYGESGSGKTWVSMLAAAQTIQNGQRVLFLDFEDHPGSVTNRMTQLGCTQQQVLELFTYISPVAPYNDRAGHYLENMVVTKGIELTIIDSTGEAVSMDGINPNADDEIAAWFRKLPRRLTRAGSTVLLLDHVPKSNEASKRFAIGSQRKLAAIDGASYRVDVTTPPAKGQEGKLRLTVAKDRHGTYRHGTTVAAITITDTAVGVLVTIADPEAAIPSDAAQKISQVLGMGTQTQNGLIEACKPLPRRAVIDTLEDLMERGYVERTLRTGKGGGFNFTLLKKYEVMDTLTIEPQTPQEPQPEPNRANRAEPRQEDPEQLPTSNRANRPAPLLKGTDGAVEGSVPTTNSTPNQTNHSGAVSHPEDLF